MIAQEFEYTAPKTLDEALHLLASGAKPLAGGMSLIPMMKLRLAAPEHLVDLRALRDLNYIREAGGQLHIGATASHYDVESSALLRQKCPLLTETAAAIGDVQVRNMGTIGGRVAHADPAAEYPAALQALQAKLVAHGRSRPFQPRLSRDRRGKSARRQDSLACRHSSCGGACRARRGRQLRLARFLRLPAASCGCSHRARAQDCALAHRVTFS